MKRIGFWLRWSARDLRDRWLLVTAIAATIALGTGAYASLESMSDWRKDANARSLALLGAHDVRLYLADGSYATPEQLESLLGAIPHRDQVAASDARLVQLTRLDASTANQTIVVPGRIVGMSPAAPSVDALDVTEGRAFEASDDGAAVALLEYHFADHYSLEPSGDVTVGDGARLRILGRAFSSDYFLVISPLGDVMAEANFGVVFVPLSTAGAITGHPGMANELVVRLNDPALAPAIRDELEAAAARMLPDAGAAVMVGEDETSRRWVLRDAGNDQSFFAMFAILMFAGATFAAFNLTTRIVESQRRQVGIGLALGLPARVLAIRPLAVAAEIALLGVVLGVAAGVLFGAALREVLVSMLPMPVFEAPLRPEVFGRAAAIGFALPFAASIYPVWRAVRARPVDAIRTGYLAARRPGLARFARRAPLPSVLRHPLSNILRTPRRTLLTSLGIGAGITVMIGTLGMLDTFSAGMNRGQAEIVGGSPDRIAVDLAAPLRADAVAAEIGAVDGAARVDTGLRLPASVGGSGGNQVDLQLDILDLGENAWQPTVNRGRTPSGSGEILLSEQAMDDAGLEIGDRLTLHHPLRSSGSQVGMVDSVVTVVGTHPSPMRATAYMDIVSADLFGMAGLANRASVVPATGADRNALRTRLFDLDGVVSAQPIDALVSSMRDTVAQLTDILAVIALFALALAVLVAYNSATISQDERTREVATMLAFGLPARRVMLSAMLESGMIGVLGTMLGLVGGATVLTWLVYVLMPDTMPDFGLDPALSPETLVAAVLLGVFAVALAPLATWRRITRMNLPATLRVVE
jgi:putative ABC transport system permease protein